MTTKPRSSRWLTRLAQGLRSPAAFWVPFGIFLFAALWMACFGRYSMAYDEYVHYGMMNIYGHQWLPFFSHQPAGADAFGAVARDPSYLYHYLMSFPYRLFAHFVPDFVAQIVFLRLWSVAFVALGLVVVRRTFRLGGISMLAGNLALGFFMLIPVVPFFAAQINYDTLLFLGVAMTAYLAVRVIVAVQETGRVPLRTLLWLASVALFSSLVKYAYAPVLLALTIAMAVFLWRHYGLGKKQLRVTWSALKAQARTWRGILVILVFLLGLGLFVERYGVNVIRYHTPTPECDQVVSIGHCLAYEPFARNYNYHQGHYALPAYKVAEYPYQNWMRGMLRSLFFVVGNKENGYPAGEPLPLARTAGYIVIVGGFVLVLVRFRFLWRQSAVNKLLIAVTGTYVVALFLQNFTDFLHLAVAVAIQGRYLLPVLPFFLVLVAQAGLPLLRRLPSWLVFGCFVILAFLLFEGGSLVPFVVRGSDAWLWDTPVVQTLHHAAYDVLSPIMIRW